MLALEREKKSTIAERFFILRPLQSTCSDYPPLKYHHPCGGTGGLFNTTGQSACPDAWLNRGLYVQQMLSLSWMLFSGFHQLPFGLQINGRRGQGVALWAGHRAGSQESWQEVETVIQYQGFLSWPHHIL